MTRVQFLNDLYRRLEPLGREQAEQHLTYYAEMLADRMEEGMSEEEAVASLEDMETIVRRILEEEGLPYVPPIEAAVAPPEYPDASRLEGGGGTRAYQPPKRRDWRRIVQAALWVAAAFAVVFAFARRTGGKQVGEYVATAVPDPGMVEEGIIWEYTETSFPGGDPAEDYEYRWGAYNFSGVAHMEIDWTSGMVQINTWGGDYIQVEELSDSQFNEHTRMSCRREGDSLVISNMKGSNCLCVLVPDGMLNELEVSTSSAGVMVGLAEINSLTVKTVSGDIGLQECYLQEASLSTSSGSITLSHARVERLSAHSISGEIYGESYIGFLECGSTSGDIWITNLDTPMDHAELRTTSGDISLYLVESYPPQSISAGTASGDIDFSLPYDMGFTVDFTTISGDYSVVDSFSPEWLDGLTVCNGGGCEIKVETVSGDLDIH